MTLYHETSGHGSDLVLVHGWGMNLGVWEPLLPALEKHYRVTRMELPGHGSSPLPAHEVDLRDWAEACVEVAPAGACWLGWSLGGQIALQAALEHPKEVGSLFLVSSTPRFVQAADWPEAMAGEVFDAFADSLAADMNGTLNRFLGLQVKGSAHARETLRALRHAVGARPAGDLHGLQLGLRLLLCNDLRGDLATLDCPVEWLFGTRDTLVPVAAATAVQSAMPCAAVHRIDGAGHAPFLSHPGQCLPLLAGHMEKRRAA